MYLYSPSGELLETNLESSMQMSVLRLGNVEEELGNVEWTLQHQTNVNALWASKIKNKNYLIDCCCYATLQLHLKQLSVRWVLF